MKRMKGGMKRKGSVLPRAEREWVLVTAGSDRVGEIVCEAFAGDGANLVIHARTERPSQHELKRRLERQYDIQVKLVVGELTKKAQVDTIFKQCPPLDVVVSNAAVFLPDDRRANMSANKHAQLLVMKAAIVHARAHRKSVVIFITGDGHLGRGNTYGKHLEGYEDSKRWVHENISKFATYGDEGIQIIGVLPGPILPPGTARARAISVMASQLHMPRKLKSPWIGKWYGRALVALSKAGPALNASCVLLDAGRNFKGQVPKEH